MTVCPKALNLALIVGREWLGALAALLEDSTAISSVLVVQFTVPCKYRSNRSNALL